MMPTSPNKPFAQVMNDAAANAKRPIIRWETSLHRVASYAQIADVERAADAPVIAGALYLSSTVRLYVRRAGKGSRHFLAYCDGKPIRGAWDTMDAAKVAVIKAAREQGLIA